MGDLAKKPAVPKRKERGKLLGFFAAKKKQKSMGHRISRSSQSSQKKASTMGLKLK